MQPHQQRVVDEKTDLDIKLSALNSFMNGDKFHVLCDEPERIRLIEQSNAMTKYSKILGERIACF